VPENYYRPKYPLKINLNQRYLIDQSDKPFLLQGDAPWSLIVGISRGEVERYLSDRKEKGFNTLLVNLIEHRFCKDPPNNFYGEAPFTTPGDFSTPNEKYFEHADWVIRRAAEFDIQILLCPVFLGIPKSDHGWYDELIALSLEKCLEYGSFLGKRYSSYDNILWSIGCDRNPCPDGLERMNMIALGIKQHDHRHLMTAQCYPESSSVDIFSSGGWLDVNATYTYSIVHRKVMIDYNRSPIMPVFLIESSYEGMHNASDAQIRRQAYWSVLCGGFGHVFGNFAIWPFGVEYGNGDEWPKSKETWQTELDKPGSFGMKYFGDFFRSLPWNKLIPDQKHVIVTSGLGEFRGLDYLATAISEDGRTLVGYMPTARTIVIDLSKIRGNSAKFSWYDPSNGKSIPMGQFPTQSSKEFTPPSQGDWAFVTEGVP